MVTFALFSLFFSIECKDERDSADAAHMRPDVLSAVVDVLFPVKETNYGRIRDERPWPAPMGRAGLRSSRAFPFSEVVIEMKGGSRRHLTSMARRLLTTPAARAGKFTRWLISSGGAVAVASSALSVRASLFSASIL